MGAAPGGISDAPSVPGDSVQPTFRPARHPGGRVTNVLRDASSGPVAHGGSEVVLETVERSGVTPLVPGDPERVGRWSLKGRLGAGGMGTVYLGVDDRGGSAAVKVIHPHLLDDPAFAERFRREVSLATQVSNRFTARVIAADFEAVPPFVATELVAGPDLARYVRERGPLPLEASMVFAGGLASALSAIHAIGIVHRDLTPRNVLLASDGPRVVDFGIARARGHAALTATGLTMGTPGWVAPEVLRGTEPALSADVFAWGLLVAYAAAGTNPFGDGPTDALLYSIAHEDPVLPPLPEPLGPLVERALDKRPEQRPTPEGILTTLQAADAEALPTDLIRAGSTWQLDVTGPLDPGSTQTPLAGTAALTSEGLQPRRRRRWIAVAGSAVLIGAVLASVAVPRLLGTTPAAEPVVSSAEATVPSGSTSSGGSSQVAVRDVAGSSPDEARSQLEADGLKVEVDGDEVEGATVATQDPPAGERVRAGSTVTLRLTEPPPPEPEPKDERITADTPLTVIGIGPFTVGTLVSEAAERADVAMLPHNSPVAGTDHFWIEYGCAEVHPLDGPWAPDAQGYHWPLSVMLWNEGGDARIARVTVEDPRLRTPSGLGVGSTRDEIITALGAERITEEPLEYREEDPTASSLFFTPSDPSERHLAMRFLLENGRVSTIHAGRADAVQYIEGCL
jgi:hypothetical protein